ncbi:hypothetical protein IDH09_03745 [Pelagibacterales bacterium SAG-MED28]|nr:hypothetical protein [Pelagibacterales bacterium SAG-MED28]|tara:strand:+ start:1348 stop:2556 length:1209 start_codon:yes stop_codon:yes gene_type:complete
MKITNYNINPYLIILLSIFGIYLFNIFVFYSNFYELIGIKGLLVNYDGGFIRRGLLGEIITSLSLNFSFKIKDLFTFFHCANYILFFYLNYILFNKFKKNFLFYFFIFSPIYFFYPLVAVTTKYAEHVIQREAYLLTIFISFIIFCTKVKNRKFVFGFGITSLLFSTLLYELTILCFPFFFTIYYIFLKRNNYLRNIFEILFATTFCLLILVFHLYFYGENDLNLMIDSLNNNFGFNYDSSDLLYSWLNQDISKQVIFLMDSFKINYVFKYIFYAHPVLLLIFINHKFINDRIYLLLFNMSIFLFAIVFAIATDWARFVHILYSLSLMTFAFYFFQSFDNIFHKIGDQIALRSKINRNLINILVFIYCIMWNLKHTFWQNHLSYGFFQIIQQNLLYFNELIF